MLNQLDCSIKKFTHVVHVADVHIRLTQRHDEYSEIFDKFYIEVEKTPASALIAIAGDLFHSKSDLSPESVQLAKNFLRSCASLRPTILIPGNHDATLTNRNRLDSLSPLIYSYKYESQREGKSQYFQNSLCDNLFYLRDTGLYGLGDVLFNNMSVFSDPSEYTKYDKIPKVYRNQYVHHIALYHGPVNGSWTDLGFQLVNKAVPVDLFDGHHVVLLGDIHKKQDLQSYDNLQSKPAVHYPGSMIQQDHSETMDGHGFSLWDLNTKTYTHINIPNDYGFFTVEVNQGKLKTDLSNLPKKARIRVKCFESVVSEVKAIVADIKNSSAVNEITYARVESQDDPDKLKLQTDIKLSDIADVTYQNKLLTDFLKEKCKVTDENTINDVLSINSDLNQKIDKTNLAKNLRWKPKKFEFSNMFSYGEGNVIDFAKCKNVLGLFGPNTCGKSSIFSALSFCIFDKFDRGYKASDVINVHKTTFICKFNFEINGVDYFIERKGKMDRKGNVKVDVKFWKEENGIVTELNGEERNDTNRLIREKIGSYEDFVLTALSVQSGKNISSFIDMGQSERKDLLSQFIGLEVFDKLLDMASNESKDTMASLKVYKKDDLELKLQSNTNELSSLTSVYNDDTKQVEALKVDSETINNEVLEQTKLLKQVEGKNFDIDSIQIVFKKKQKDLADFKKWKDEAHLKITRDNEVIAQFDQKLSELSAKNIEENYKKYQKFKSELSHLEQTFGVKKVEVENKLKKKSMLDKHEYDPNCKYCVNSVFVQDARKIAGELQIEKVKVKELLEERNRLKIQVDLFEWSVAAQEEYNSCLKKKNDFLNQHSLKTSSLKSLEVNIDKLEKEVAELNKDIESYNKQTEAIEFNKVVQSRIGKLQQDIKNIDFNISAKNKHILKMTERIGVLKSQIQDLTSSIEKAKGLEKKAEAYTLYLKAVNRDGLPYMVIANTVPEIEREVNNILNQMVDFRLNIETDGKNVIPYIVYDDCKWIIEMSSGFEKFVSSLAIRVALTNISNLPRTSFLCVDEGFGVIDSTNMPSVQTLLSFLKTNFDFIVVISHLDDLRDMVDKHIEVKKENGFSSVNFV